MVATRRTRKRSVVKKACKPTTMRVRRKTKRKKVATASPTINSAGVSSEKQSPEQTCEAKETLHLEYFQNCGVNSSIKDCDMTNFEKTVSNEADNTPKETSLLSDAEEMEEETSCKNSEFCFHFEREFKSEEMEHKRETEFTWPSIGNFKYINCPNVTDINITNPIDPKKYRIKPNKELSLVQKELLNIFYNYIDIFYFAQTMESEQIQTAYCLHILNHVLTSRAKIVHHNSKIKKYDNIPEEFRDQGFTRPKILIVVPFKHMALQIVMTMAALLGEGIDIMNKKKFLREYGTGESDVPKRNKPEDYETTFKGNIDDAFRIGIAVRKKCLKLYVEFYSSDIIIASPLGLRTIIGASGEDDCDYDFLSSIEILILDKCDIFLMQNWEHVINVMQHLNQIPKKTHCNYFRVRMWALDGLSRLYRQTLMFSSVVTPQILSLFNKYCYNYAGKIALKNTVEQGCITKILIQLPQVFQQFDAHSISMASEERFSFFVKKILPLFRDTAITNILIFIPYYWDFVRLRNYFRQQEISFTQICEYTKSGKIAEARDHFFHGHKKFLLFTERFHFFHRYKIKGIAHLIFYQLPVYPHFYSELCNLMTYEMQNKEAMVLKGSSMVLYCKFDFLQLSAVIGTEKSNYLLSDDKKMHMFVSGT